MVYWGVEITLRGMQKEFVEVGQGVVSMDVILATYSDERKYCERLPGAIAWADVVRRRRSTEVRIHQLK